MKKIYEVPAFRVEIFETEDIITVSVHDLTFNAGNTGDKPTWVCDIETDVKFPEEK